MVTPLFVLHTFVMVARLGSMKQAAERLSVTPGAVSQRIRQLEEAGGERLFLRGRTGVTLNEAGQALFAVLDGPFATIDRAASTLAAKRDGRNERLVVSTLADFAASWLNPRLDRFAAANADVDIAIETESRLADLQSGPADMAIRRGLGSYPGLVSRWLMAPERMVVASPELLRAGPPIDRPGDCLAYPLLHDFARNDWPPWLEAHGVSPPDRPLGPCFADQLLVVRAAVAGQGLALVREVQAREDLAQGWLVRAIAIGWPAQFAYYAVTTPEGLKRPALRRFRDWLVQEAEVH